MTTEPARAGADWLALREPADAAARDTGLVDRVRGLLPRGRPLEIHDLGCGSGAMARWLAPRLRGPQHWMMYDRDSALLSLVAPAPPGPAADGGPVTFETRERDITRLGSDQLAGASLITASAVLDMMTAPELDRFTTACSGPGCPVLITLTVTGRVELAPADPFDDIVAGAFNDHQRRDRGEGRLLGPDAVDAAAAAFAALGRQTLVRPSPWRLGPDQRELVEAWFTGWLGPACEQSPELESDGAAYSRSRLAHAAAGELMVTVHHQDLLVLP